MLAADEASEAELIMPMDAGVGDCLGLLGINEEFGFNRSEPKLEDE
jgi:hypothetical protein